MMLRTLTSILSCKCLLMWSETSGVCWKKKKNTGILPAPPWQQDQPPALQASDKSPRFYVESKYQSVWS